MSEKTKKLPSPQSRVASSEARRPLGTRFLHQMLLPLLVAFLVASASGVVISHLIVHNEVEARRQMILDIHAPTLAASLRNCDYTTIARSLGILTSQSEVAGLVLSSSCPQSPVQIGAPPDSSKSQEDYFIRDIVYVDEQGGEVTVGTLEVEFEALVLWGAVASLLWRYMLVCALMVTVMMVGALITFRQIVSTPVGRFRDAVSRQIGNQVTTPVFDYSHNDEFGDLVDAYANLMVELASVIEKLRNNEKALLQVVRVEPLTGLGNRIVLEEELSFAVALALLENSEGYLLLIDLDDFKIINDTHGHNAGDYVLQEVARRLRTAVRSTDTVARLGGDEFAVVLEGKSLAKAIPDLVQTLVGLISAPIEYEGKTLTVGASIGIASFPSDGSNLKTLLAHADRAMYATKQRKR